jgi:predicted restriction endonuclease
MLKTCSICGRIHDFNKICKRQSKKNDTSANSFRKTNKWTEMSKAIRKRDKYLCKVCLSEKYDTQYKYTYKELEVHHIVPIEEDYSKRLDSSNLITLCRMHHEMAERGDISREELLKLIK